MPNQSFLRKDFREFKQIYYMKKLLLFSFLIFASFQLFAQPVPPAPIPIDGGIGFLVAAGVGYGVSRLRKRKEE